MFKKILAGIAVSVLPLSALAQAAAPTYTGQSGLVGLLIWFSRVLSLAVPVIIALAVVWFIFSVFQYIIAGNEEAKAKAKEHIIWGIVGLFIMVSVWGLVRVISSTFNLDTTATNGPVVPTL